jgi:threonine-phosphate decarboxylase
MHPDVGMAAHGGDLAAVARRYGVPAGCLVDFSANVNVLGPPEALMTALATAASDRAALQRYPDPESAPLRDALAQHLRLDPQALVIANGAAALLDAAVRVHAVRACLVPVPAFSEYGRALAAARAQLVPLQLPGGDFRLRPAAVAAALATGSAAACLFANPHNPSGALVPYEDARAIVQAVHDARALALVDEAFIDFAPEHTIAALAAATPATIVIRSLTKFFGVPALRVGYAVCEPGLARALRATLPPWPVTTLAAAALAAALADTAFAERTLRETARERDRFATRLRSLGFVVFPSAANFLLLHLPRDAPPAGELVRRLIVSHRLVVRDCSSYAGLAAGRYVRVAVRTPGEDDRLVAALAACAKEPCAGAPM